MSILSKIIFTILLFITILGPAKADDNGIESIENESSDYEKSMYNEEIYDPFEPVNRVIFKFNNVADKIVLEPVSKGYRKLPAPVQTGVGNFFNNLKLPLVIFNQFLQGQFGNAAGSAGRLVINSTVGLGGLVDVAEKFGLEQQEEDFGQTLATWGVGDGPYLVLPIFGPSNLRDAAGLVVSSATDPVNVYLADQGEGEWIVYRTTGNAVNQRARIIDEVNTLRENSVDYYSAVKSAYHQNRYAAIRDRDDDQLTPIPVISVEFE
ncbi:MAG: putative phospholipid-binding lipoprotein MlaA [Alphaproteobacteria bacterium MarineAlpha5_Bin11]|nr:MAG: putative phospholipid-binding lipoprotein MlaA [Alphaproteobacteria bacterium MarineAlpha5_Bin11]